MTSTENDYQPHVAGLPREITVRRETLDGAESDEIQRIDSVMLREGFGAEATRKVVGQVAYIRRQRLDGAGSYSEYGWIPLGQLPTSSYGVRIKKDAIRLLPKVAEFLSSYED